MPAGRPSNYSDELADEICSLVRDGLPIREIALFDGLPTDRTIWRWLDEKPEFRQKYASAKEVQAERQAEELLEIADNGRNDWMERHQDGEAVLVPDHEHINRSRLRVDTRKWLMSKMLPKKYGDRTSIEHSGAVSVDMLTDSALSVRLFAELVALGIAEDQARALVEDQRGSAIEHVAAQDDEG